MFTNRTLKCRSSAKVNLTLDVLSRREDGYHELRSIIHTIGLYDSLRFDFRFNQSSEPNRATTRDDLTLQCDQTDLQSDDNLCLKAARAWLQAARAASANDSRSDSKCASSRDTGAKRHAIADGEQKDAAYISASSMEEAAIDLARFAGARITLGKTIPHGAGLGGGSGNAGATLLAFNNAFGGLLNDAIMHRLALEMGADVPFFLRGGCALMEGIGERLSPLPAQNGWLLVAQPDVRLSTPRVFKAWDALGTTSSHATQALRTVLAQRHDALGDGSRANLEANRESPANERERSIMLAKLLHNDLADAAQNTGAPIARMLDVLRHSGALGTCMSGSGSAVFGVYENQAAAQRAFDALQSQTIRFKSPGCELTLAFLAVVPLCARGVEFDIATD